MISPGGSAIPPKSLPQSEHFIYHELAEGVWAAIVKPAGLAASNSGIVDLGDQTLVFDTTLSPVSAADLRVNWKTPAMARWRRKPSTRSRACSARISAAN